MTDAHCHLWRGEDRAFLCEPFAPGVAPREGDAVFYGTHPWFLEGFDADALRTRLEADPSAGVGEIGLDRLKDRTVSPRMREVFETQLLLAGELGRPVVLHGAKCWGDVVKTIDRLFAPGTGRMRPPAFLFHGFSRSGGLLPDIIRLNGFISVGPALLNDHAVNYRTLVKAIPLDRLLLESDATAETASSLPTLAALAEKLAEIKGLPQASLLAHLESNATRFLP